MAVLWLTRTGTASGATGKGRHCVGRNGRGKVSGKGTRQWTTEAGEGVRSAPKGRRWWGVLRQQRIGALHSARWLMGVCVWVVESRYLGVEEPQN